MRRFALTVLLAGASSAGATPGQTIAGSKHDFSTSGPGTIRAVSEGNPCVFCHASHGAPGMDNRPDPRQPHRPYESSTLDVKPGTPSGASRICLSCHDGTIAVGETRTRRIATRGGAIPADRPSNLGTDLRRSHPISFGATGGRKTRPPGRGDAVRLDRSGALQCTSCHDAHREYGDPLEGMFLLKPSRHSELCLSCHDQAAVTPAGSSHAGSTAAYGASEGNERGYRSVGEAGCRACHRPHGADEGGRLLAKKPGEDDALCLRCHGKTTARADVERDWTKPYSHQGEQGVHDASEGRPGSTRRLPETSPGARRHATCVDCHEPHAAASRAQAQAPEANGALSGTWGIDQNGLRVDPVQFEYEVCFKCHADSANKPQGRGPRPPSTLRRAFAEANLREQLGPSAASFHPVVGPGRNLDVPGLRPPLGPQSLIYCTDCHASDTGPGAGGSGARGPHGSVYPALLERNYDTRDFTAESPFAYALCYKCHDRDVLLSDRSAFTDRTGTPAVPLHRKHVVEQRAPCSACHASHGVSAMAGDPEEHAHLVDFDVSIVKPGPAGLRRYRSAGPGRGSCNLSCHGKPHDELVEDY